MKAIYNKKAAEQFWTKRLNSTDPLSAVLSYDGPPELNRIYDVWERSSLTKAVRSSLEGKKLLDLASGTGRIALHMAGMGASVTALDISQAMLDYVIGVAQKKRLTSRLKCIHSSADAIPDNIGKFDIITCCGLLEHLPGPLRKKTMIGAFRLLKKRGKMLAVVNNSENLFLKGHYRLKGQKRNGYYATLVGLKWINSVCRGANMKTRVVACNPFYAVAHYYLYPNRGKLFKSNGDFKHICELALRCDSNAGLENPVRDRLASHFLVEIRHQK